MKTVTKGSTFNHCDFRYLIISWPTIWGIVITIMQASRWPVLWKTPDLHSWKKFLVTDWNIRGVNAALVISIFKLIVNDRGDYKPSYSLSVSKAKREWSPFILYRSQKNQPGNSESIVKTFNEKWEFRKINLQLNSTDQAVQKNTREFVRDIKRVFKNNLELFDCKKEIIQDVSVYSFFCSRLGAERCSTSHWSRPLKRNKHLVSCR